MMKKLSVKEAKKVCSEFNLGKFKSVKLIKGGLINYNFDLKTDKGSFIVRVLGKSLTLKKKKRLKEEFKILKFLQKNKFPYKIPSPMKNKKNFLFKINNKNLWVYPKIEGSILKRPNEKQIKEIAKALAIYHKIIKNFRKDNKSEDRGFINWVNEDCDKLENIHSKDKIFRLINKNSELIEFSKEMAAKKRSNLNVFPIHRDLTMENVLFKGNHLVGIIDFDNIETHPRVYDIAASVKGTCFLRGRLDKKKFKIFKTQYKKFNKLSKKEEDLIIFYILRELCALIIWYYFYLKKEKHKRYEFTEYALTEMKNLVKDFKLK